MDADLDNIRLLLRAIRADLMKKKNVVATGIGYKTVAGKKMPGLAIVCSVDVKIGVSGLSKRDLIPSLIDSIPTDVIPVGTIRALKGSRQRHRPAPGGVSVGHFLVTAGTLGCWVKKDDVIYMLSNNHILANTNNASSGDAILQPAPLDRGRTNDRIAVLHDYVPINFDDGGVNTVDCAIAQPVDNGYVRNEISGIGTIAGISTGELGMKVRKYGRTTGMTTGVIEQVDVTVRVSYGADKTALFAGQTAAGAMSEGGDSGAAMLDMNNNIVGLLFAGSNSLTFMNNITDVFEALDLTLA